MPEFDALLLARIQFAFTISFHIIFPALTIGLASFLAVLEGLWLWTRKGVYLDLYHFWLKIFAVAFGMGVVSGLVMAYQFGTNWSEFSRFAGGPFDWITPFSVFTGLGLVVAYALLGCTWLVMKCEDQLQARMRHLGNFLTGGLFAVIALLSAWTPLTQPEIAERWFSLPNLFWFLPVPILVLACTGGLFWALRRDTHYAPFLLTLALIFLSYSGLGISLWPNVIPPSVSIWDAAGPAQSLGFTLVGTLFIVPFVLMYTAFAYWVFRGKVRRGEGYH